MPWPVSTSIIAMLTLGLGCHRPHLKLERLRLWVDEIEQGSDLSGPKARPLKDLLCGHGQTRPSSGDNVVLGVAPVSEETESGQVVGG